MVRAHRYGEVTGTTYLAFLECAENEPTLPCQTPLSHVLVYLFQASDKSRRRTSRCW